MTSKLRILGEWDVGDNALLTFSTDYYGDTAIRCNLQFDVASCFASIGISACVHGWEGIELARKLDDLHSHTLDSANWQSEDGELNFLFTRHHLDPSKICLEAHLLQELIGANESWRIHGSIVGFKFSDTFLPQISKLLLDTIREFQVDVDPNVRYRHSPFHTQ